MEKRNNMIKDEDMPGNIDPTYQRPQNPITFTKTAKSLFIIDYDPGHYLVVIIDTNRMKFAEIMECDRVDRLLSAANRGIDYDFTLETPMVFLYSGTKKTVRLQRIIIKVLNNTKIIRRMT